MKDTLSKLQALPRQKIESAVRALVNKAKGLLGLNGSYASQYQGLLVKPVTALVIVAFLGYPARTALTVAIGLGQIGEFSFILGTLGRSLGLLPEEAYQLIIAGAIISIAVNPIAFRLTEKLGQVWQPSLAARPGLVPVAATTEGATDAGRRSA